jgi:hypothetical protein
MISRVHRPADPLLLSHRPVLREGLRAVDAGRIGACRGVDVVGAAVGGDGALEGAPGGGVVGAEVLDDVVFDEGGAGPAVDGEVGVAGGGVGAGVGDFAGLGRILC